MPKQVGRTACQQDLIERQFTSNLSQERADVQWCRDGGGADQDRGICIDNNEEQSLLKPNLGLGVL